MSDKSGIQWTDATWNCIRGCARISAGCQRCYAERQAYRFNGPGQPYEGLTKMTSHGPVWTGEVRCIPELLDQPLRWTKPRRVFVNSMSDLFHESVPDEFIERVLTTTVHAKIHTFQILTKRPERMRSVMQRWTDMNGRPQSNLVLGVSVEDQATADERIPLLLQTPAAVRFVSYEPALGPVDFEHVETHDHRSPLGTWCDALNGCFTDSPKLDWIIVGGESGPKARPCDIAWIQSAVDQCKAAGVACFVKQLGADPQFDQGCGDCDPCIGGGQCCVGAIKIRLDLNDRKGGDMQEWPSDLRVREFPR